MLKSPEEEERIGLLTSEKSAGRSPFSFFKPPSQLAFSRKAQERKVTLYSLDTASPFDEDDLRKHFGDSSGARDKPQPFWAEAEHQIELDHQQRSDGRPSLGAAVWAGIKQNLVPGFVVLIIGAAVVAAYYFYEPARMWFDGIAAFKAKTGFLFSLVSTAVFGGVLPFLIMLLKDSLTSCCSKAREKRKKMERTDQGQAWNGESASPAKDGQVIVEDDDDAAVDLKGRKGYADLAEYERSVMHDEVDDRDEDADADQSKSSVRMNVARLVFYALWWGYKGVEVDAFYRLQGLFFGQGTDIVTIAIKVFVDQFIYNPIWAAPSNTIAFMWKDCDFSFARLKAVFGWDFVTFRVPSVLCSTWMVWVPAVSLIYSLPSTLQIPLFNLVLCFFVLILSFIVTKGSS